MTMNKIALKKWMKISENIWEKIEHNVFCVKCKRAVHIVDYEVEMSNIAPIITEKCKTCGHVLRRVIED